MMLDYVIPDGFTGIKYRECFDSLYQYSVILPCMTSHIVADNKHFQVSFLVYNKFTRSNCDHNIEIARNIRFSYGDFFVDSMKDYVQSDVGAQISTNADTVIICPLLLKKGSFYNQYNHCNVVYLQKKNRGFIALYCFYDDVAFADRDKYMQKVKRMFHYRDGEVDVEKSDILAEEEVITIGRVTARKPETVR
jgi:hypothetical protein